MTRITGTTGTAATQTVDEAAAKTSGLQAKLAKGLGETAAVAGPDGFVSSVDISKLSAPQQKALLHALFPTATTTPLTNERVQAEISRLTTTLGPERAQVFLAQACQSAGAHTLWDTRSGLNEADAKLFAKNDIRQGYVRNFPTDLDACKRYSANLGFSIQERVWVLEQVRIGGKPLTQDQIKDILKEQQTTNETALSDQSQQFWGALGVSGKMPSLIMLGTGDGTLTAGLDGIANKGIALFSYNLDQLKWAPNPHINPGSVQIHGLEQQSKSYTPQRDPVFIRPNMYGFNGNGGEVTLSIGERQFSIREQDSHGLQIGGPVKGFVLEPGGDAKHKSYTPDGAQLPRVTVFFDARGRVSDIRVEQAPPFQELGVSLKSIQKDEMNLELQVYGADPADIKKDPGEIMLDLGSTFPSGKYKREDMNPQAFEAEGQKILEFIKTFGANQQVTLTIEASESRVTNPKGFERPGSLAEARQATAQAFLDEFLRKNGVDPKNVKVELAPALVGGDTFKAGDNAHDAKFTQHQYLRARMKLTGEQH